MDEILLLSGNDVPFFEAKVNVHQPTLKDISMVGEEPFFIGCQLLNFSKDVLSEEDKINLADVDDFEVLMSILCDEANEQSIYAKMVLTLLFPEYRLIFDPKAIVLVRETEEAHITAESFVSFKKILSAMFLLNKGGAQSKEEFNPKNDAARKIAEKLQKGREKVAQEKGLDKKKTAILTRYVSILSIGLQLSVVEIMGYTLYQLYDSFKRFQMFQEFDINLRARMAGATDLDEVDNWMEDFHS